MRKPASFYFFKRKPIVLKDRYERWRKVSRPFRLCNPGEIESMALQL